MTRLNNDIRADICQKMLDHRFGDEMKELVLDKVKFAEAVYNSVYSKTVRNQMHKLPNGWLCEGYKLQVCFGASYTDVYFSGTCHGKLHYLIRNWKDIPDIHRRVLRKHEHNAAKVYSALDPLSERHEELANRQKTLLNKVSEAEKAITASLSKVSSVERLLDLWPEAKPFLAPYLNQKPQLPSVPVATLNTLLDLPV
ncbi:Nmad5 family putative nucleotide modification protein [Brucella anthropi]|uniref:Nmad5 family putative nucleotide modification protein n=1 Tax=Brucella anthropi TaxID=529 RepID=UPI000F66394C|nr:Nmad5 family putative nucleotide modification protein [Brucella anthropi]RRY03797.1 hypothetical protein EGJ58_22095 [Brucella anthropi]